MATNDLKIQGFAGAIATKYIPTANAIDAPLGMKILALAHTVAEGFYPGSVAYRTNNPGNIGTSTGPNHKPVVATLPSLIDGITKQIQHLQGILAGTNVYYPGGGNLTLTAYLRIYAPPSDGNNVTSYVNTVISCFAKQGIRITASTTLFEIAGIEGNGLSAGAEKKKPSTKLGVGAASVLNHFSTFFFGY